MVPRWLNFPSLSKYGDMINIPHLADSPPGAVENNVADYPVAAQESLAVLFLDHRGAVAHSYQRTDGDGSLVQLNARNIVHEALTHRHERFILVHNHPSGDPTPSPADISATKHLCRIVTALGLELVDHLILAPAESFSFRAAGLL